MSNEIFILLRNENESRIRVTCFLTYLDNEQGDLMSIWVYTIDITNILSEIMHIIL